MQVVGGGPAGAMAALAALRAGAGPVRICEKSAFPRHKVCGEFLSPAILELLRRAGCEAAFLALKPAALREMRLIFNSRQTVHHTLPEPAFGLSRYELDRLLLNHAVEQGAAVVRENWQGSTERAGQALIMATGRRSIAPPGDRLFGFKAHFAGGPVNDAVELYFFDRCYVGVSAVEGGVTNVCGLAPEGLLRTSGFDGGEVVQSCEALSARLRGLTRQMDWMVTGPLVFSEGLPAAAGSATYAAGDALGFIDPFTGSGMLNGMVTGELAGLAAARGESSEAYLADCRRLLRRPLWVSSLFRAVIRSGYAGALASFVPGRLLFAATRPALAG